MNPQNKRILRILAIVGSVGLVYYLYKKNKSKLATSGTTTTTTTTTKKGTDNTTPGGTNVMHEEISGTTVPVSLGLETTTPARTKSLWVEFMNPDDVKKFSQGDKILLNCEQAGYINASGEIFKIGMGTLGKNRNIAYLTVPFTSKRLIQGTLTKV